MRTLYLDSLRILAHYRTLKASSDESYKILGISFSYAFPQWVLQVLRMKLRNRLVEFILWKNVRYMVLKDGPVSPTLWVSRAAQGWWACWICCKLQTETKFDRLRCVQRYPHTFVGIATFFSSSWASTLPNSSRINYLLNRISCCN